MACADKLCRWRRSSSRSRQRKVWRWILRVQRFKQSKERFFVHRLDGTGDVLVLLFERLVVSARGRAASNFRCRACRLPAHNRSSCRRRYRCDAGNISGSTGTFRRVERARSRAFARDTLVPRRAPGPSLCIRRQMREADELGERRIKIPSECGK